MSKLRIVEMLEEGVRALMGREFVFIVMLEPLWDS